MATDQAGVWIVMWETSDSLGETIGSDFDIIMARSDDNGLSWSTVVPVNTDAAIDPAGDNLPAVATDKLGTWVTIWDRDGDPVVATSTDDGLTWSTPLQIGVGADGGFGSFPHIATDGAGLWLAVWRSLDTLGGALGPDLDILYGAFQRRGLDLEFASACRSGCRNRGGVQY